MPLPAILTGAAKRCEALTKRTKQRCWAPAAHGCRTCRVHGAKRSRTAASGEAHWNYKHGECSKTARVAYSAASQHLDRLEALGRSMGFIVGPKRRGRKAGK